MSITREVLLARLDSLYRGRDEILSELHATSGAIQEAEYWLQQLEKLEAEEEVKPGRNYSVTQTEET